MAALKLSEATADRCRRLAPPCGHTIATVTDGDEGAKMKLVWRRTRSVGAALVLAAAVVVLAGGCGSGSTSDSSATTVSTGALHHAQHHHHHAPRYTGLGATPAAFRRSNEQPPPNPDGVPAGLAWYTIQRVDGRGRVTAYEVTENARPAMPDRTRLVLVAGNMLPGWPRAIGLIHNTNTCIVYRDPLLKRLTGVEYAAATTFAGTTMARMTAEARPSCPFFG